MPVPKCPKCKTGLLVREREQDAQDTFACVSCGNRIYTMPGPNTLVIRSKVITALPEPRPNDAWHEGGKVIHPPWRFPLQKSTRGDDWESKKFFEPHRGDGKFKGGGTVEIEVFLAGAWHWMRFTTDGKAFRKLADLPELSRARLLDSLALVPVHAKLLPSDPKRPRGVNHRDVAFWLNVDYWTPHLRAWAAEGRVTDKLYKKALTRIRLEKFVVRGPDDIAGALCVLAWQSLHVLNKDRFSVPGGVNLVKQVSSRIQKRMKMRRDIREESLAITAAAQEAGLPEKHSRDIPPAILAGLDARRDALSKKEGALPFGLEGPLLPISPQALVTAILDNDLQKVPVLSPPEEFGPSVPMVDFRIF